ncbi:MAG: hypothetical protein IJB79_00965 [Candidatus Gastranaerophilales bacterium]|nr:hypothetical protein [Candidatus Gastranaerophilales bacterium]
MKILFYDIKKFELDYLSKNKLMENEVYFFQNPINDSLRIDEKYLDCEALSVFVSSQLDNKTLSKFKNLKYIFLRSVGYSNVDLAYCKNNNIFVFNAPNYGNSTVAEYVFSLLLTLSKKILKAQNSLLNGEINHDDLRGIELFSKTMGVIGVGAIGRKVINIAHGFGMEVLAYDVYKNGAYNFVELDELLKKSDFISINCPLNDSTRNLIDKIAISKMKRNAILINTARGEIVDSEALFYALIEKRIKGAALDVVECEEYLCHNWKKCNKNSQMKSFCLKKFFFIRKLLRLPNVLITPHNAYNTKEAQKRILDIVLENINSSFDIKSGAKNLVLL